MSSAPDIRRRPHWVHLAPSGQRFRDASSFFKRTFCLALKIFKHLIFLKFFKDATCGLAILRSTIWKTVAGFLHPSRRSEHSWPPLIQFGSFQVGAKLSPAQASRSMTHRRRRVFVETSRGRVSAGFTVPEAADAADVSMALRRRGWSPYRLRLEAEQHAWVAIVIDWQKAA